MPEYTFESIAIKRRREGLVLERDYREVVREHAAAGWEFVQAISFEAHVDARLDLVFVRAGGESRPRDARNASRNAPRKLSKPSE